VNGLGQYVFSVASFTPIRTPGEGFRGKVGNGRSVPIPKAGG
jgi:hypothetical protein